MPNVAAPAPKNATLEQLHLFEPFRYTSDVPTWSTLEDVTVTRSGLLLRGLLPVLESLPPYPHRLGRALAIGIGSRLRRPTPMLSADQEVIVTHTLWSGGFFHWMTEDLVKLASIPEWQRDREVLLPSHTSLSSVMEESAKLLGFSNLRWFPQASNVRARTVLYAHNNLRQAHFDPESIHRMRDQLRIASDVGDSSGSRRIYVTRKRTSRRKVANEVEVSAALVRRGFDVIDFEGLSLAEQVRISAQANIFVSIHGAGLTNTMFMAPGSTVVELYPEVGGRPRPTPLSRVYGPSICYRRLAAVMNHQYNILFCATESSIVDEADITVDIKQLDAVVSRLIGGHYHLTKISPYPKSDASA